jgi:hypothetical protein
MHNGLRLPGSIKMAEDHAVGLPPRSGASSVDVITAAHPEMTARENDAALLALGKRFNALAAELATVRRANCDPGVNPGPRSFDRKIEHRHQEGCGALTRQVEAILARLCPIERAIMQTPACTIAGLGVKARHAAYVMSQYWEAPIDRIDWDARAVRLLIEAVCDVTRTPLPFRNVSGEE